MIVPYQVSGPARADGLARTTKQESRNGNYIDVAVEWLRGYGPSILAAVVIFVVGWTVAKVIRGVLRRALNRAGFDETLSVFLSRLAYMLLLAFVVIVAIQKLAVLPSLINGLTPQGQAPEASSLESALGNLLSGLG